MLLLCSRPSRLKYCHVHSAVSRFEKCGTGCDAVALGGILKRGYRVLGLIDIDKLVFDHVISRWALIRNQVTDLIKHERIQTTVAKAKEASGLHSNDSHQSSFIIF